VGFHSGTDHDHEHFILDHGWRLHDRRGKYDG